MRKGKRRKRKSKRCGPERNRPSQQKTNPENLAILRVERATPRSPASAPVRTATPRAITPFLPTIAVMVITPMIATIITPVIPWQDHHRATRRNGAIHDHRFAARRWFADDHRHRRRARRRDDGHGARGVKDWHGQPKIEADGNSCLGGAGQSEGCYHCYESEQMFCFHGRSDAALGDIFDSAPLIKTLDYRVRR
jgi:hypothetical protein